jgi:hypothetical protein
VPDSRFAELADRSERPPKSLSRMQIVEIRWLRIDEDTPRQALAYREVSSAYAFVFERKRSFDQVAFPRASVGSFSCEASLALSRAIAGPNVAITESRLNDAAFWRGGYFTKLSI